MTNKRKYLNLLLQMKIDWLLESARNPSKYMNSFHVKLHYLAIRILQTGK